MKPLHLREQHSKLGAVFREVVGYEVPASYGNVAAECHAVRTGVAVADLSHRATLRVTGEDRVKWLQSIISNDILPLSPGQGLSASVLTHKGKMVTYFRVYLQPDAVVLEDVGEIGDITFQALRKFLLYGTKAKMEQTRDTHGLLLVSGPQAIQLIKEAFDIEVHGLGLLGSRTVQIADHEALLIRTEETGEQDFEIFIPAQGFGAAWQRLYEVGSPRRLRPFGTEAREILRIEAGLPHAGADLNEDIVPPEANLESTVSLTKGCYPGQEVVARMDTYGTIRRRLVGLTLSDPVVPMKGAKLFSGEREVGWVSSAVQSPQLGKTIAFGFPLRDFATPGTALTVEIAGAQHPATVTPLPFLPQPSPPSAR
jgi:aminomethyltransferase